MFVPSKETSDKRESACDKTRCTNDTRGREHKPVSTKCAQTLEVGALSGSDMRFDETDASTLRKELQILAKSLIPDT